MHPKATMRASVLVALILATVTGCKKPEDAGSAEGKASPIPPVKVTAVAAPEAETPEVLVLTGLVTADQRSDVTADTQGKVLNVYVERGQRVKLGQALAALDVRTAALGAREAQANLAAVRAQKQLADQECTRTKTLLEKGAITQSEYDRQMTQCSAALEQVSAVQARTEIMTKSVADGIVHAPFDGIVSEKMIAPGEWVAPGKPLFTIVDNDPLKIELSVPERAVRAIKLNERVELASVAYPDQTFGATITRLGAEIGRSRALIAEARIDKNDLLVPGMFAEAHVAIGKKPRVVLPANALIKRGTRWRAFVIKADKATGNKEIEERVVQVASDPAPGLRAIDQGVSPGEQVVTNVTHAVLVPPPSWLLSALPRLQTRMQTDGEPTVLVDGTPVVE
jgi:RND family efflux transporter MFP subunit